jgi:predicted MPP superfamily phosphohydrolase
MGIKIVHLSDFHFNEMNNKNLLKKLPGLTTSLKNLQNKNDKLLIIVSGDIAYSGVEIEYSYAINFFGQLYKNLSDCFESVEQYFVPGNHDCDFSIYESDEKRKEEINRVIGNTSKISDDDVKQVSRVLKNYYFFEEQNSGATKKISLLQREKTVINGRTKINLFLLNTAWMSKLKENKDIFMPKEYFNFDGDSSEQAENEYNLFVHHHPRSWFRSVDDHTFRRWIEKKNGIVLTGHEHSEDAHIKKTKSNDMLYSVGGTFDGDNSVFKVINICDDTTIIEDTYLWAEEYGAFIIETNKHYNLNLSVKKMPKVSDTYRDFLDDLGMLISHPRKRIPTLSDLYVNPYLSMSVNKGKSHEIRIRDEEVIETLRSEERCVIDGDYGSGKTSLAKRLIFDFIYTDKYVVLYVDVSKNTEAFNNKVRLSNYFDQLMSEQYEKKVMTIFRSIPKDSRVVILDNYNLLYEKETRIEVLHSFISDMFGKVFIFSNSKARVSGYLKFDKFLLDFNSYNIEVFGPKLQKKIIEKWNKLENYEDTDVDLIRKNREDASIIKTLLEDNNLPQTPDAILTILSTSQTKKADNTSLYGHLLTNIISTAMGKADIDGDSQEEVFRILSIFAYSLYINESRIMDFSELKAIIEKDNLDYGLVNSAANLLDKLTQSNIVQNEDIGESGSKISEIQCKVAFRYNYLYSYFVARHISKNLSDSEVLAELDILLDDINLEDSSRIIINVWYFTNDNILLAKLDQKISKTMTYYKVFDYKNPPKIIQELNEHKNSILINLKEIDGNVDRNRNDLLEREEEAAQKKSNNIQSYNETETETNNEAEIIELNTVLNLISTIGQIIKCYGGSIKADQKEYLIEKCYELGMKSLSFMFEILNDQDVFINYVKAKFESDSTLSYEEVYDETIKLVSFLIQFSAFSSVYRVSEALSSIKIAPTFKQYLLSTNSVGIRLVDLAISYLFLNNEKTLTVETLINDTQNDFLSQSVIRIIIWRYYFYNTAKSKPEKDKLLSKLNIKNGNRLVMSSIK